MSGGERALKTHDLSDVRSGNPQLKGSSESSTSGYLYASRCRSKQSFGLYIKNFTHYERVGPVRCEKNDCLKSFLLSSVRIC